jgi:hypothetical protein
VAILLLAALVFSVPVSRVRVLRAAGRALVVDDPLSPADAIILPEWTGAAGAIDAADLVHAGIAKHVAVIPGNPRPAELELARRGVAYQSETDDLVHMLRALGVSDIEVIQMEATGTGAEGQIIPAWCHQRHVRSVVVVSAPDHARRLRRILHRSMDLRTTRVFIRAARFSEFDPDRWWTTRDGARTEIVELQKLLLDLVRHPLS